MTFHSKQTAIHVIYNWEYADAAARTGATGFVAADVGKLAKQTDTGEYWELTATTPTWEQKIIGSLNVGTPASGNALVYNGSNWVAGNVSAGQADSLIESFQNETGGTLSQLEAVYISGFDIPSGLATIAKADASNVSTMPSIGIVENDITTGNSGNVIISGLLGGVDTSSFSANDILYVSATTPGQLTATRPTGAADKVQELAEVIRSHATQGIIQVFGSGSAALLSNLPQNTAWVGDVNNAPTSTSVVLADGSIAGATGAAQDFGVNGILTDAITDSGAGVITVNDDLDMVAGVDVYPDNSTNGLNARFENLFGDDVPANTHEWTNNTFLTDGTDQAGFETDTTAASDSYTPTSNFSKDNSGTVQFYAQKHYLKIDSLSGTAALVWSRATASVLARIIAQFTTQTATYAGEMRFWDVQSPGASDNYWALRFIYDPTTYPDWPHRIKLFKGTGVTYSATDGTEVSQTAYVPYQPARYHIDFSVGGGRIVVYLVHTSGALLRSSGTSPTSIFDSTDASYPANFKTMRIHIPASFQRAGIDSIKVS